MKIRHQIILDQLVSSAGAVLQLVVLAKYSGLDALGVVSLVLGVQAVANGCIKAATTEVFLYKFHQFGSVDTRVYSTVLMLALAFFPVFALTNLLPGVTMGLALVFGFGSVALTLRDCVRFLHYVSGRVRRAIAWNVAGFLLDTGGLLLLLALDLDIASAFAVIMAVSLVMAALQMLRAHIRPSWRNASGWFGVHRRDSMFFGSEALAGGLGTYIVLPIVGLAIGPAAAGVVRLTQAILGPLGIALNSLRYADIGRLSRTIKSSSMLQLELAKTSVGLLSLSLALGYAIYLLPTPFLDDLIGEAAAPVQGIILAMALQKGCAAASIPYTVALKLLGKAGWAATLRVVAILATALGCLVGTLIGGLDAVTWVMACVAFTLLILHGYAIDLCSRPRP